jgi:predicted membrane protein
MKKKSLGGLIIIAIGIILLLQKMNILSGDFWGYFWPVVLILIGLGLIFKNK